MQDKIKMEARVGEEEKCKKYLMRTFKLIVPWENFPFVEFALEHSQAFCTSQKDPDK